jgi:predicted RNA methylase
MAGDPLDDWILIELFGTYRALFFPEEIPAFPRVGWILDVGAHHGIYSVAALFHYPGARLIAVEPDPDGVRMLRHNLALNGLLSRTEIVPGAIAAEEGHGLLLRSVEGSWSWVCWREPDAYDTPTW